MAHDHYPDALLRNPLPVSATEAEADPGHRWQYCVAIRVLEILQGTWDTLTKTGDRFRGLDLPLVIRVCLPFSCSRLNGNGQRNDQCTADRPTDR